MNRPSSSISVNKRTKVFFIDLDNTLLDTGRLKKEAMTQAIENFFSRQPHPNQAISRSQQFWDLYQEIKHIDGQISIPDLAIQVANQMKLPELATPLKQTLLQLPFQNYVFPKVAKTLKQLSQSARLVVVSSTDPAYGTAKLNGSRLAPYFDELYLFPDKRDHLAQLVKKYSHYKLSFVDDQLPILEAFSQVSPHAETIWISTGPYASLQATDLSFKPTFSLKAFSQLQELLPTQLL